MGNKNSIIPKDDNNEENDENDDNDVFSPVVVLPPNISIYSGMDEKGMYCPFHNNPTSTALWFDNFEIANGYARRYKEGCIWEYKVTSPVSLINFGSVYIQSLFCEYLNTLIEEAVLHRDKYELLCIKFVLGLQLPSTKKRLLELETISNKEYEKPYRETNKTILTDTFFTTVMKAVEPYLYQKTNECLSKSRMSFDHIDKLMVKHVEKFINLQFPSCVGYINNASLKQDGTFFHSEIGIFRNKGYRQFLTPTRMLHKKQNRYRLFTLETGNDKLRDLYKGDFCKSFSDKLFDEKEGIASSPNQFITSCNYKTYHANLFVPNVVRYNKLNLLSFDSIVVNQLFCSYLSSMEYKIETIDTINPFTLTIYSWNVCFGCMTNNSPNQDRTAGKLATMCKEDNCFQNIKKTFIGWASSLDPPDLFFLQEASRGLELYTGLSDDYEAVATKKGESELAIFYRKKYTRLFMSHGDIDGEGRPYIVIGLRDERGNEFTCINLHFPHIPYDVTDFQTILTKMENMENVEIFGEYNGDDIHTFLTSKPLIIGGDWNSGIYKDGFPIFGQYASSDHDLPNTCCTGAVQHRSSSYNTDYSPVDYILISPQLRYLSSNQIPTFDRDLLTSDHLPVMCKIGYENREKVQTEDFENIQDIRRFFQNKPQYAENCNVFDASLIDKSRTTRLIPYIQHFYRTKLAANLYKDLGTFTPKIDGAIISPEKIIRF
jgi:endonuclease/exonuclease/phosphatase family metal-dependent hydrolase